MSKKSKRRKAPRVRVRLREIPVKKGYPQGRKELYSLSQVEKALERSGGVKAVAGRLLKKWTGRGSGHTATVNLYLDRYPHLLPILEKAGEYVGDVAEDKLIKAIKDDTRRDHLRAVIFYLCTKGKKRGYTSRSELTGADGAPLHPEPVQNPIDLTKLTDKELVQLEAIYAKARVLTTDESSRRGNGHVPGSFNGSGRDPAGKGA